MSERSWLGPVMVLIGGIAIAYAPIGVRFALDEMGPLGIAFWRYVFATPMLLALILVTKRRLPVKPNRYAILAGIFFALDMVLWHLSLTMTTVANSTFIVNLGNLCVGLTAWVALKEKPPRVWAFAALVAVTGAAFLSLGGGANSKGSLDGDALALGAAVLVSGYMVSAKVARRDMGALDVIFWATVTEMFVGGLATLVSSEQIIPASLSALRIPLSLAIIVQLGGQGLIIAGIGRTSAALAGVIVLIQPVMAAAISWSLFNEPLVSLQIFGAALILTGVLLAQRGEILEKKL